MPEGKTTWQFSGQDDLSPILRQIADTFKVMGIEGADVGKKLNAAMGELGKGGWTFGDPKLATALQSYRTQVQGLTGDLQKLFQAAGGPIQVFRGAFEREFAQFMRDPAKKMAEGWSTEAMAGSKFAVADLERAKELQAVQRANRKEAEGMAIAAEQIAQHLKEASAAKLAEETAKAATAAEEFAAAMRDSGKEIEKDAIELEHIEEIAKRTQQTREFIERGPTGRAGALAAGQRAMAENAKALVERRREMAEMPPLGEEKGAGGFAGRLVKDIAWGAESFLRYMIVWKTLDSVIKGTGETFQSSVQILTTQGGSFKQNAIAVGELNLAALITGQSVQKLTQDMVALRSVGFNRQEAMGGAIAGGIVEMLTGAPVNQLEVKAKLYQATAKDLMMAAQAGGPFRGMQGIAEEARNLEALEPVWKMYHQRRQTFESRDLEDRQRAMQEYLEDEHTRQSDNMEDRHRSIQEQMEAEHTALSRYEEDRQEAIKNEIEDRHYMINREMEERHIAISQQIEDQQYAENRELEASHRIADQERADRHRVAEEAASDEERLHSRRESFLESVPGAMDALAQMYGQHIKGKIAPIGRHAAAYLKSEMDKGFAEMAKEGIDPRFAKEAIREGMSPGVVLKFAEAAREDERIARRRREEQEDRQASRREKQEDLDNEDRHHKQSITIQRQFQKESRAEAEAQHAESIRVGRGLHLEARMMNRLLQDQQRAAALLIAHEEIDQRRKFRQEDLAMQRAAHLEALTMERALQDEEMEFEFKMLDIRIQGNEMILNAYRAMMNAMMPIITTTLKTLSNILSPGSAALIPDWKPMVASKEETETQKRIHGMMDEMRGDTQKQRYHTDASTKSIQSRTDKENAQREAQDDATASTDQLRQKFDEASKAVDDFARTLESGGALPEVPTTGVGGVGVGAAAAGEVTAERGGGGGGTSGGKVYTWGFGGGMTTGSSLEEAKAKSDQQYQWSRQPHVGGELPPWASQEQRLQKQYSDWSRQPHVPGEQHPWDVGGFMYEADKQRREAAKKKVEAGVALTPAEQKMAEQQRQLKVGAGATPEEQSKWFRGEQAQMTGSRGGKEYERWTMNMPGDGAAGRQFKLDLPGPKKGESKAEYGAELVIAMLKMITVGVLDIDKILDQTFAAP